jgi:hypothetical protein
MPAVFPKGECTNEIIKPSFKWVKPDDPFTKRETNCPEIFAPQHS